VLTNDRKETIHVNLISGVVLLNSEPPSLLPQDIIEHRLYVRIFGNRNFSVVKRESGIRETTKAISGFYYQFQLISSDLIIRQTIDPNKKGLRLLNCIDGEEVEKWAPSLPIRLKNMYSYWYSDEGYVLYLRPVHFMDRRVFHIIQWNKESNKTFQVPQENWNSSLEILSEKMETFPRLVQFNVKCKSFLKVLSKFEDESFIHGSVHNENFVLEFPRFRLEFEMKTNIFKFRFWNPALGQVISALSRESNRLYDLFHPHEKDDQKKKNIKSRELYDENIDTQVHGLDRSCTVVQNFRCRLKREEQIHFSTPNKDSIYRETKQSNIVLLNLVTQQEKLETYQNYVLSLVINQERKEKHVFPLVTSCKSDYEKEELQNLQESFYIYQKANKLSLQYSTEETRKTLNDLNLSVTNMIRCLLEYISHHFQLTAPNDVSSLSMNGLPKVTPADLVQFIVQPNLMQEFNPSLSETTLTYLKEVIMLWMQYCVFEDKLSRCLVYLKSNSKDMLIQELKFVRIWSVSEYPLWLIFELDGGIQIREEQYELMQRVLKTNGAISQLNMGSGKTRVIVPCLFLALANRFFLERKDSLLIRINILPQIFEEGFDYLHLNLCANFIGRKVFQFPFHRDVKINMEALRTMVGAMKLYTDMGACIVVTSEQRNSLYLKLEELILALESESSLEEIKKTKGMIELLHQLIHFKYYDIFDESDSILHPKKQLIYSVGDKMELDGSQNRWKTAQLLIHILITHHERILPNATYVINSAKCNEFPGLLILPKKKFDNMKMMISTSILNTLFSHPPLEFAWVTQFCNSRKNAKDSLIKFILDIETDTDKYFTRNEFYNKSLYDQMLSLRGLLGYGLLYYCLSKRYKVDFGLYLNGTKKMAVPYIGADTPSPRNEFSHPDCAILYSIISWYSHGLREKEVNEVFHHLKSLPALTKQQKEYQSWLSIHPDQMEAKSIDHVDKIDLSNQTQQASLYEMFSKNYLTIDYYLKLVFPGETCVFEKRLMASSFDLCYRTNQFIGFSGTRDTNPLMPPIAKPIVSTENTDGMVLHHVMSKSSYEILPNVGLKTIQAILIDFVVKKKLHALIDVGAILAGISNNLFADLLLQELPELYRGVVYFGIEENEWIFKNRNGRTWRLKNSPIREQDAFVFFDQRRCRGADMKLVSDAKACVTIAPKLQKDDFMQACGRMRGLIHNQTLVLVGNNDVTDLIRESCELNTKESVSVRHVLEYTFKNVIRTIEDGLPMLYQNGVHYAGKADNFSMNCALENFDLIKMYNGSLKAKSMKQFAEEIRESQLERMMQMNLSINKYGHLVREMNKKLDKYKNSSILKSGQDEECERQRQMLKKRKWVHQNGITNHFNSFTLIFYVNIWL
jgi:hypothetical protein